jgi:hypothetical protein
LLLLELLEWAELVATIVEVVTEVVFVEDVGEHVLHDLKQQLVLV